MTHRERPVVDEGKGFKAGVGGRIRLSAADLGLRLRLRTWSVSLLIQLTGYYCGLNGNNAAEIYLMVANRFTRTRQAIRANQSQTIAFKRLNIYIKGYSAKLK